MKTTCPLVQSSKGNLSLWVICFVSSWLIYRIKYPVKYCIVYWRHMCEWCWQIFGPVHFQETDQIIKPQNFILSIYFIHLFILFLKGFLVGLRMFQHPHHRRMLTNLLLSSKLLRFLINASSQTFIYLNKSVILKLTFLVLLLKKIV